MIMNPGIIDTNYDHDSYTAAAARSGRILAEMSTEEAPLVGHLAIGIYADGTYSRGFKMPTDQPFIGPTLFCAMLKEIIAREMTGQLAAEDYAREYLR